MYSKWKQQVGDPLTPQQWPPRARVGINGFGKTARLILRCAMDDNRGIDIVAINAPNLTPEQMLYLIKYNTSHGRFKGYIKNEVQVVRPDNEKFGQHCALEIAGRSIAVFHQEDASKIPWNWLNVEYVLETTGTCLHLRDATKHLTGGRASKVLVVGDTYDIPLLMYPISCRGYQRGTCVVATGSAMAHAAATTVSIVDAALEFSESLATFVLPVEGVQNLVDGYSKVPLNWRMGRGAVQSIIPGRCPTVVQSVIQALPKLHGRFDAITMHVPTFEGALIDLTCRTNEAIANVSEALELITNNPTLRQYNQLHTFSQPYRNNPHCDIGLGRVSPTTSSSLVETKTKHDTTNSESGSSLMDTVTRTDLNQTITVPSDFTSIMVPLNREDAFVSSDAVGKHTMSLLNLDCTFGLPGMNTIKFVSWFDLSLSYCERILDTLVYMRGVDHA